MTEDEVIRSAFLRYIQEKYSDCEPTGMPCENVGHCACWHQVIGAIERHRHELTELTG